MSNYYAEISSYQRELIDSLQYFTDEETKTQAVFIPFQETRISPRFVADVVKNLMTGGKILQAQVYMSRLDLLKKIPYGEAFDKRFDIANHWFLILRTRLHWISIEKMRSGMFIQTTSMDNKDMVVSNLMGEPRNKTRVNVNKLPMLPNTLDVNIDDLHQTIVTGITSGWSLLNYNCQDFVKECLRQMS